MKVIHVPFGFRPDPIGGTEVYVEALAREQQRRNLEVVVAAPGPGTGCHSDAGLRVRRFATSEGGELKSLYGEGDETARRAFANIVDQEQPDIVHLHAYSSAVSARLAGDTRARGARLVFTYHTPTVSCQRGTLLRWGSDVCDGNLDVHLCAGCTLHGLGLSRRASVLLGALPSRVGHAVGEIGLAGGPWTGLRMSALMQTRHAAFRALMEDVDRVVVLCQWARELLVLNGIPHQKLMLSRHGLSQPVSNPARGPTQQTNRSSTSPLRIAFLGRLHPTKGVEILLRALATLPGGRLTLHVFGVSESDDSDGYARSLRALAANDPRISLCPPVANNQVTSLLHDFDVLAVPSQWLETGPLVVLEAFAAGIPVIGANRGGIAELVTDGVDGLLVKPESIADWSAALDQLANDPRLLPRLRSGVRPPRLMTDVADDMLRLYSELLEPG